MERSIRAIGKKISSMGKEGKRGWMGLCMMATITMGKSKAWAFLNGQMALFTRASSTITTLKAREGTVGLMEEPTLVRGKAIKCTELVFSHGQTADAMRDNTWKIRSTVQGLSFGQMVANT